jgi:hypothetical protein
MTVANRMIARAPVVLTVGLALALAGCELFQPPPLPPPPRPTLPMSERLPSPPHRKPAPPGASLARLESGMHAAVGLDKLIGLDQTQVADMLGEPRSRTQAPPATIWRYAGAGCEVDVYFYMDLQSQAMRALHYEVRSHEQPERSHQRCYDALRREWRRRHDDAGSDRPR